MGANHDDRIEDDRTRVDQMIDEFREAQSRRRAKANAVKGNDQASGTVVTGVARGAGEPPQPDERVNYDDVPSTGPSSESSE